MDAEMTKTFHDVSLRWTILNCSSSSTSLIPLFTSSCAHYVAYVSVLAPSSFRQALRAKTHIYLHSALPKGLVWLFYFCCFLLIICSKDIKVRRVIKVCCFPSFLNHFFFIFGYSMSTGSADRVMYTEWTEGKPLFSFCLFCCFCFLIWLYLYFWGVVFFFLLNHWTPEALVVWGVLN